MTVTHVRIFYPADPLGVVPGGIDTFLRGLIKWAPPDLEFSLVGMTTDVQARPPGKWTRCRIGQRDFDFFPVVVVEDAGGRAWLPLSARFSFGLLRYRACVTGNFDVFDFHRPEPSLLFLADRRPKNAYFHNDPETILLKQSDNLWRRLPAIYENIEKRAVNDFDSAWCVRESGVEVLRRRYPALASNIHFIPTWVDSEVFNAIDDVARQALRVELAAAHRLDLQARWIITVGRLDTQKDPFLMLAAFARLRAQGQQVDWLVVGDGVLRPELMRAVAAGGLEAHVHFLGLRPPSEIADLIRASDVYALSSAYEGMPMALLEALGCGLPVAVTDVGEVRRVVKPGINGEIAAAREDGAFSLALGLVLDRLETMRGLPATQAIEAYQPAKVLAAAYENYRRLGSEHARIRERAQEARAELDQRSQDHVIGLPIDLLDRVEASARIMAWAKRCESRTVCFVNVHSAVYASLNESHRQVLLGADLVAPDGAPIAWSLRRKGHAGQPRVDGPGMMLRLCGEAMAAGVKVGLYGATEETLGILIKQLKLAYPQLDIAYAYSPPFRPLSESEEAKVCADVAQAGVGLLFVSLGCPKQEHWMARHRGRIPAVLLGVGAAFDFHAGTAPRAPEWLREHGLEWLHRLASQPRRLWRRYLFTNSMFLGLSAQEALRALVRRRSSSTFPRRPNDEDECKS